MGVPSYAELRRTTSNREEWRQRAGTVSRIATIGRFLRRPNRYVMRQYHQVDWFREPSDHSPISRQRQSASVSVRQRQTAAGSGKNPTSIGKEDFEKTPDTQRNLR